MAGLSRKRVAWLLATCLLLSSTVVMAAGTALEVWLPFKRGYWAKCARSTKAGHGWIFNLREGPPVVAALEGRVFQVNHPLGILVDHGEGRYGAYMINGRWEAEVQPGQLIPVGTELADIDKRGDRKRGGVPFLNFSMRGPSPKRKHDLRFRLAGSKKAVEINKQTSYLSGTRKRAASGGSFKDSTLKGNEFAANRVLLEPGNAMYWLESGEEIIYEGKVKGPAPDFVIFHLWTKTEEKQWPLSYTARTKPAADGTFVLKVNIPTNVRGTCKYRIASRKGEGMISGKVQISAGVGPKLDLN